MAVQASLKGCSLKGLFHLSKKHLSSTCLDAAPFLEEELNFIPKSIFERIRSSPNEVDPALFDDKQVALSQQEIEVGQRWNLLNWTKSSDSLGSGYFLPNEWIQLLTHSTYYNGIAVNNTKFAILGEPLTSFLINTNSNLFTDSNTPPPEESSFRMTSAVSELEESFKFLNRTSHLGSSIHIAHRMRFMGITGIIRCHRDDHTIREPSLKIIQTVFHALVGGIHHKAGMEAANGFVKQTLTFKVPKQAHQ